MRPILLSVLCIAVCAEARCYYNTSFVYAGLAKKADKSLVDMVEKHLKIKFKDDTLMFKAVFEEGKAKEVYVAVGGANDIKAKVVSFKGDTGKTVRLRALSAKLTSCKREGPTVDFSEFRNLVKAAD